MKCPLSRKVTKLKVLESIFFHIKLTRSCVDKMSSFDSDSVTCDPTLFPVKNSRKKAKGNHLFPGKERGDRALLLTYLAR